jgi:hypothetical protein
MIRSCHVMCHVTYNSFVKQHVTLRESCHSCMDIHDWTDKRVEIKVISITLCMRIYSAQYYRTMCQPLVSVYDSASVSTIDNTINSTGWGNHERNMCNHCGKTGHRSTICFGKYMGTPKKAGVAATAGSTNSSAMPSSSTTASTTNTAPAKDSKIQADLLASLMEQVKAQEEQIKVLSASFKSGTSSSCI